MKSSRWTARARRLLTGFLGLMLLAVGVRVALFRGPYRAPKPAPPPPLVDLHVHTAGIGAGDSGCQISRALQDSYKFKIYLDAFGVTREEVEREGDALLIR